MTEEATLIAIDPGALSGAYAAFRIGNGATVADLAVVDGQLDAASFAHLIMRIKPSVAVVEKVGAMPKQGVASTFKFGKACGLIEGVLASMGIPFPPCQPPCLEEALGPHWQRQGGCKGSGDTALSQCPGLGPEERPEPRRGPINWTLVSPPQGLSRQALEARKRRRR